LELFRTASSEYPSIIFRDNLRKDLKLFWATSPLAFGALQDCIFKISLNYI
jgi:hypothetical protein